MAQARAQCIGAAFNAKLLLARPPRQVLLWVMQRSQKAGESGKPHTGSVEPFDQLSSVATWRQLYKSMGIPGVHFPPATACHGMPPCWLQVGLHTLACNEAPAQ